MNHNESIGCNVTECKYHCKDDNYCTLSKIQVIKNSNTANTQECTDCASFKNQ
ncbi:MAG: DUF1540 domain-containing protein [Eubacteriales bacterium]